MELMGGLGNQLFQICCALAYGIEKDHMCYFLDRNTSSNRPTYWNSLLSELRGTLVSDRSQVMPYRVYREPGFSYHPLPTMAGNTCLFGYFQSERYFYTSWPRIRTLLRIDDKQAATWSKYTGSWSPVLWSTTVSLHFRLGDYKNLKDHHPVMPMTYYKKALTQLTTKKNQPIKQVLYFYEKEDETTVQLSIQVLQKMFPDLEFQPVQDGLQDWEQMLLMSRCAHHVIANSSFSWWGAYLNETNADKQVMYPATWFGPAAGHNTRDLCPPSWTQISF